MHIKVTVEINGRRWWAETYRFANFSVGGLNMRVCVASTASPNPNGQGLSGHTGPYQTPRCELSDYGVPLWPFSSTSGS